MTYQPADQLVHDAFMIDVLAPTRVRKAKWGKEFPRLGLFQREMGQSDLNAFGFDVRSNFF